ncbi:short-chain dehydrogenase/reductase [Streptomyces sulfonofaciens]|uniref:Short-chain dehydrogenase/reductase n=1 Tax=Streptomyces sulfonofaciens TaxID=68272 RepID=A0A919FWB7_9ACTN|nr:SDR family NAD(P)-dependent oxidoreductase [Streptomyces sulfonofaciens]GHH73505.1 short-chain dehydrogenase/reductase [Streptomyces sulfonofaciens]
MSKIVLVAEASSGLGAATATALADTGHTVYAGVGPFTVHPAAGPAMPDRRTRDHDAPLRPIALNTADQRSVSTAIAGILAEAGRIDAVVHVAGPVPRGPVESFTPYQLAQIYDAHVLSTQRVNRSVLPQMRQRREGLLVWMVPGDREGASFPYLALHSAAVTVIEHLAESYARELIGFGIETTIVAAGFPTPVTGSRLRAVHPDDTEAVLSYEGRYPGLLHRVEVQLAEQTPAEAEVARTALAIAAAVGRPKGARPLRITAARSGCGPGSGTSR